MYIATSEIIRKDEYSNNLEWTLRLMDSAINPSMDSNSEKILNVNSTYLLRFHDSIY